MKFENFFILLIFLNLVGTLRIVNAGNFQINLENSTTIDTLNRSYQLSGSKMNNKLFASADSCDGINLYEIKGDLITVEKKVGGFKISGEDFWGVAFHPEEKDYLTGVSKGGKAVLLRVN
jgi:hypothetical protein